VQRRLPREAWEAHAEGMAEPSGAHGRCLGDPARGGLRGRRSSAPLASLDRALRRRGRGGRVLLRPRGARRARQGTRGRHRAPHDRRGHRVGTPRRVARGRDPRLPLRDQRGLRGVHRGAHAQRHPRAHGPRPQDRPPPARRQGGARPGRSAQARRRVHRAARRGRADRRRGARRALGCESGPRDGRVGAGREGARGRGLRRVHQRRGRARRAGHQGVRGEHDLAHHPARRGGAGEERQEPALHRALRAPLQPRGAPRRGAPRGRPHGPRARGGDVAPPGGRLPRRGGALRARDLGPDHARRGDRHRGAARHPDQRRRAPRRAREGAGRRARQDGARSRSADRR
jgi:hypothetical protein